MGAGFENLRIRAIGTSYEDAKHWDVVSEEERIGTIIVPVENVVDSNRADTFAVRIPDGDGKNYASIYIPKAASACRLDVDGRHYEALDISVNGTHYGEHAIEGGMYTFTDTRLNSGDIPAAQIVESYSHPEDMLEDAYQSCLAAVDEFKAHQMTLLPDLPSDLVDIPSVESEASLEL